MHNSVGNKTKTIRPRLRPRLKLQDQDQDKDQNYKTKTKTEAGLRPVLSKDRGFRPQDWRRLPSRLRELSALLFTWLFTWYGRTRSLRKLRIRPRALRVFSITLHYRFFKRGLSKNRKYCIVSYRNRYTVH